MKKGKATTETPAKQTKARALKSAIARTKRSSGAAKQDPRKAPVPTAPASVAAKAVEAIAPVARVAMAEPKKIDAANPGGSPRTSVEAEKPEAAPPAASKLAAASARLVNDAKVGSDRAPAGMARVSEDGEELRKAVTETTTTASRSLVELNGKVLDLWRAQSEAAIDLWRSTLSAGSLSEAVRVQTSGYSRSYEASASGWKEISESAGRLMTDAARNLQSALTQAR